MTTPPLPDFDRDMALEQVADGVWRGHVWRHWYIVSGANGGLRATQATRAMVLASGDPERLPRSLTLHYLEAPTEGPLDYAVTVERVGRSATSVSIRVKQEEKLVALGLGWLGTWREDGPSWTESQMPAVPAACAVVAAAPDENQRSHRDRRAAESAPRCRSQRESGTGPRATVELSVAQRTSSSQASAVLLDRFLQSQLTEPGLLLLLRREHTATACFEARGLTITALGRAAR